jgi:predicted  nucleic acid-binding Zn-ribbon protein
MPGFNRSRAYNLPQRFRRGGQRNQMLIRAVFSTFLLVATIPASFGQSTESDSQILREILAELRAMHQDMRVTESTQILVAELQMEQSAVIRATESADNARARLSDIHRDQKTAEADLARTQEQLDKATSLDEQNALSNEIARQKSNIASLKIAERDSAATLQQMEERLQVAQEKLASIDDELNGVISRLTSRDAGQK